MAVDMKLVEWIKANRLKLSRAEMIQQCKAEGNAEQDVIDSYNEVVNQSGQTAVSTIEQNISQSSRLVALLLCWFLGGTGAHRFYTGKSGSGVIMLLLLLIGIITSFFLIGFIFIIPLGIWVLIDFIMIIAGAFTDGKGKRVLNWTQSPTAYSGVAELSPNKQANSRLWIYVVIGAAAVFLIIIGILAAIAVPNFMAMQGRAKEASVKGGMHTLNLAIEDYAANNRGTYPSTLTSQHFLTYLPNGQMPSNPYKGSASMSIAKEKVVRNPVRFASEHSACDGKATEGEINYYFNSAKSPTIWAINGCNDRGVIKNADGSFYVLHN
ncbi:MAG: TM2 domain-containing protein [Deltaproteobacteria bacterium]|nr:TM2 domain-containing protein [Deltaproteobacteria bacterium]